MRMEIVKAYRNLPAAHRQPNHGGHCRFIHGHDWGFDIKFAAEELDENHFVVDFGGLKNLEKELKHWFDHTLLLNADDPMLEHLRQVLVTKLRWTEEDPKEDSPLAQIRLVPNCGAEGLAMFVHGLTVKFLEENFKIDVDARGLRVVEVTCWEDSKNAAIFKSDE